MKPLSKPQRRSFQFFRNRGFKVKEARELARLSYPQLASLLSQRLGELSKRQRRESHEGRH